MSLIEQAAQRLEALRKAGADIPEPAASAEHFDTARDAVANAEPFASAVESLVVDRDRTEPGLPRDRTDPAVARDRRSQGRHSKIVEIDLEALGAAGFLTPDLPNSQIADEFRVIKRPIIRNTQGKGTEVDRANLVMVTSALPGEGKSFVALNLAMSIATEVDSTV